MPWNTFSRRSWTWPTMTDAVVVIDADTVVDPGILTAFAATLAEGKTGSSATTR